MNPTYAEYLKSQGATDEEIKILDTPTGRKAYEAMVARAATADAAAAKDKAERERYDNWFTNELTPAVKKTETERDLALADAARIRAFLKSAAERGVLEIPKELGIDAPPPPKKDEPPALDSRYVTTDTLLQVAEREGDAIALAQDIAYEHRLLFPDRPLNFRELRKQAVAAKKPVEQLWMETYKVAEAREARAKSEREAYEKKLREEGASAERERLASQYGNPDTRPLTPSASPFALRKDTGRDKQPWERKDDASNDRVSRAAKHVIELQSKTA